MTTHRDPTKTRDQLTADLDELTTLWPALAEALQRDHTPGTDDKVTATGNTLTIPVNVDVLRTLATLNGEIPNTAWWCCNILAEPHNPNRDIPGHLRHMPRWYDRMNATNVPDHAHSLATTIRRWRNDAKTAIGLRVRDRHLGQYCPRHDDPLNELVAPGDEGWLRYRHTDPNGRPTDATIDWTHTDAVLCRTCGATWTPGQYLLLGRLLRDADHRRTQDAA